jgi:hypothetical protein
MQAEDNQTEIDDPIKMSRNLCDINFFELKIIASRLTGKKATAHNVMQDGATKHVKEFGLKNSYIARAVNLIMCGKGQYKMMCDISKAIGDEAMKKLTVSAPAIELFKLVQTADIDSDKLASLLSGMASRQLEISQLEESENS